jgi:hypothetical protein
MLPKSKMGDAISQVERVKARIIRTRPKAGRDRSGEVRHQTWQ